jgi:hypothetical protein
MDDTQDSDVISFPTVHKGFRIIRDKGFGTFSVARIGKGRIPDCLTGAFQSHKMVMALIDRLDVKGN